VKLAAATAVLIASSTLSAETAPTPGIEDARLQTLVERVGEPGRLVVFPEASLTLIMRQGERIQRVVVSDNSAFHVAVTGNDDSISITPLRPGVAASLQVDTASGSHEFNVETGRGLAAAYVVRLVAASPALPGAGEGSGEPDLASMNGRYTVKGDRGLRPARIADDGAKTYIEWGAQQSLPAVLGVGAGGEEVVPGYMRHGIFTIDRVYPELVFRIDKRESTAVRQAAASGSR